MSDEWCSVLHAIADEVLRRNPLPAEVDMRTRFDRAEREGFALHAVPLAGYGTFFSDVFVGVTADTPATVAVSIRASAADVVRWVLSVRPGIITPVVDGRSLLPLIWLRFNPVDVEVLDGDESVRFVGATTSRSARRGCFAKHQAFRMSDGKTLVIGNGMAGVTDAPPTDAHMVLPDVMGMWDRQAAEARQQFWDESMAEFVARTWEPARHVQWCLPIDEIPHEPLRVHADARVDVDALLADLGTLGPPRMQPLSSKPVVAAIMADLAASLGMRVSGECFVAGSTPNGMHSHRDEPLCGGDLGLIVYLTDCVGGRLVFEDGDGEELQPGRGVVASWGIRRLHHAERVITGDKRFVFVEMCRTQ